MSKVRFAPGSMLFFLVIFLLSSRPGSGYKILMVFPSHSRSHLIIGSTLLKGLAERGHEVTMVSSFPHAAPIANNYRDIHIELPDILKRAYTETMSKNAGKVDWTHTVKVIPAVMAYSSGILRNAEVAAMMATETFDLVIISVIGGRIHAGLAAHFKCPLAMLVPMRPLQTMADMVGNPLQLAAVPHLFMGYSGQMTFAQRTKNMLFYAVEILIGWLTYPIETYYYRSMFPAAHYPPLDEVLLNTSLILTSHHFSQGPPVAQVPAIVEIGGIQMDRELEPLPQEIQEFLDASPEGAIYFSLGTNLRIDGLPEGKVKAIIGALRRSGSRVLFKCDEPDQFKDLPANILALPWLPQREILAHPNVKLFVSHGGLGSMNEAKYYGVPVLGMPMYTDQPANVRNAVKAGWAMKLDFHEFTEEKLLEGIRSMMADPKYRETVQRAAELYRDRPMRPMDTASYWIEYVIRHKGAKHMQSPAVHMNLMQRNSIDVLGFVAVLVFALYRTLRAIVQRLARKRRTERLTKEETRKKLIKID